jgi:predicted  nucleic acid-binding Zn-ribbon protein
MKREELVKLGIAEDLVDKIMALHGSDIESHKAKLTTAQAEVDGLKKQVTDANAAIEGFKKMDVDGIKAAADEWKAKAEAAQAEAVKQVAQLKFDHALDGELVTAKAKNAKAVKALLQPDALKLNDDGSILGLKEQIEKIKTENDFLFDSDQPTPKIVVGANSKTVIGDPMIQAARKAAGLPVEGAK